MSSSDFPVGEVLEELLRNLPLPEIDDKRIDTGDVIDATDCPELSFDISQLSGLDDQTLYRAIFSFCDPILRADFLVRCVLRPETDLTALPAKPQSPRDGITYHFMHPALRRKALECLFLDTRVPQVSKPTPSAMPAAV